MQFLASWGGNVNCQLCPTLFPLFCFLFSHFIMAMGTLLFFVPKPRLTPDKWRCFRSFKLWSFRWHRSPYPRVITGVTLTSNPIFDNLLVMPRSARYLKHVHPV